MGNDYVYDILWHTKSNKPHAKLHINVVLPVLSSVKITFMTAN